MFRCTDLDLAEFKLAKEKGLNLKNRSDLN